MHKTYNLVELFSGIGSQAKALKNLGVEVNTLGTSEWDVHAIAVYDVIHNSPEIPAEVESMSKEQLLGILSIILSVTPERNHWITAHSRLTPLKRYAAYTLAFSGTKILLISVVWMENCSRIMLIY